MAIRNSKEVRYNGKFYFNMKEFCNTFDVNYQMFSTSMRMGISVDQFMKEFYEKKGELAPHLKDSAITVEAVEKPMQVVANTTKFVGGSKRKFSKIIEFPADLVTELMKLTNIKCVNLIDFENFADDASVLDNYVQDENTVNVFFFNVVRYSNNFYLLDKDSKSINFQIPTMNVASQLVDHMLVYYLGVLTAINSKLQYNLISKDSGYYMFINELDLNNVNIIGFENYFVDKEKRFEISLARYISELRIDSMKALNERDMKNIFRAFMDRVRKLPTQKNYEELFKSLIELRLIKYYEATSSSSEYYMINKNRADLIMSRCNDK